jgi:superkiller protein 3
LKFYVIGGEKKPYNMSALVKKFNPLEMSEDLILAIATGREKILDQMLHEMKVCLKKGSNQHFMLYGPRGIGKSFFTRLLKIHHDRSDIFKESQYIQLPEEQENINFAADLLDVISTILEGGNLVDAIPKWNISDIQWQTSIKRLKAAISEKEKHGIKHIFVTQENLQVFIPKLDKIESSRLRTFLSDFDQITLIGSSLRPDLDNDYSKRLFQVFKKIDIEPWSSDDFISYYEKVAQQSQNGDTQLENIKRTRKKIKAISQFTGGSPRLAVLLGKLILEKNILETAQLLDGLIDELTSYYQDITNDIPAKSKILFDMLIRKGENMTQSTLAASFDPPLDQSTIARSFGWLSDNYYVVYSKQNKGNTKYFYVRDRLYVLYYQKRQIYADVPYSFVGVFVDFLSQYYTQQERKAELQNLPLDHPYAHPLLCHFAKKEGIDFIETENVSIIRDRIMDKYENIPNKESKAKELHLMNKAKEYFENGIVFYEKGELEKAITAFKKSIEINPDDAYVQYNLGIIYWSRGETNKAISSYKKAIEINPKFVPAYYNLGTIFGLKLEHEKAIEVFQKAITLDNGDVSTYLNLGIAFVNNGELEKAIETYKIAESISPSYAPIFYCLGNAYRKKEEFDKAIFAFEKAISLDPDNATIFNNLGTAYGEKGELNKAIIAYQKAIELDSNYDSAYYNLGISYRKNGEFDKAITLYQKAISLRPNDGTFYNNLGIVLGAKKELDNALAAYKKAIILNPNDVLAFNNLGNLYMEMGELDKSINAFEQAIRLNPAHTSAIYNLGNVFRIKGDFELAHQYLLKAMMLESNIPFILDTLYSALIIIITQEKWQYLDQYIKLWKGQESFSNLLGEALYKVIIENQAEKFTYFKKTIDAIYQKDSINAYEVVNALCLGLYQDGDLDFLRQITDELERDYKDDPFMSLNLQVYRYLLHPNDYDINQLHPDVRTVVNSILQDK